MLRLETLSTSMATTRYGTEARLVVHASSKHFINDVHPTQQVISLLTDLYPIHHVDPAKQTFSLTWLQMFCHTEPLQTISSLDLFLAGRSLLQKPMRISLTVYVTEWVSPGKHMRFLPQQNNGIGSSWEPMSHLKYPWFRFLKATKAVPQLMTFPLVHSQKHGVPGMW